jgi:hypothetical protein
MTSLTAGFDHIAALNLPDYPPGEIAVLNSPDHSAALKLTAVKTLGHTSLHFLIGQLP